MEIEKAWSLFRSGGRLRGASTISQQVAKNLFLWQGKSWVRKVLEAWFTLAIELTWPKRRILEVYMNATDRSKYPIPFTLQNSPFLSIIESPNAKTR